MKQGQIRKFAALLAISLLLGSFLAVAVFLAAESPADNTYFLLPNISSKEAEFVCTVQGNSTANVSAVRLYTNYTGTWESNVTNGSAIPIVGNLSNVSFGVHNFFPIQANTPDGFRMIWSCNMELNVTGGSAYNNTFTANRTIFVERPPNQIIIQSYENRAGLLNNTLKPNISDTANLNLSVISPYLSMAIAGGNLTDCDVYANDTGTWRFKQRVLGIQNNSATDFPKNFTERFVENRSVSVGAQCWERSVPQSFNWSANLTLNIDYTSPTLAAITSNGSSILNSNSVNLTFEVTDADAVRCNVFHNFTGIWTANVTNRTVASYGVAQRVTNLFTGTAQSMDDGTNAWAVYCEDFTGHNVSVNVTFDLDTVAPLIFNITNFSQTGYVDALFVEWNTSENANNSILYGNTTSLLNNNRSGAGTTFGRTQSVLIKATPEITNYYNVTSCDAAGNCNVSSFRQSSVANFNVTRWPVYAGWTAYMNFDPSTTMGELANKSNADYTYVWNKTSQSWLAHTLGGSGNAQTTLLYGEAYWLFRSANWSFGRNVTPRAEPQSTGFTGFQYNLTTGINFIGVLRNYEMTNLTSTFRNATGGYLVSINATSQGAAPNTGLDISQRKIDFFAYWSNVDQKYLSHFRNSTFGNRTNLTVGGVFVVGTSLNVTWNSSAIIGNWTNS